MSSLVQGLRDKAQRSIDAGVPFTWDAPTILLAFDELQAEIDLLNAEKARKDEAIAKFVESSKNILAGYQSRPAIQLEREHVDTSVDRYCWCDGTYHESEHPKDNGPGHDREVRETMSREDDMKLTKTQLLDLLDEYRQDQDDAWKMWADACMSVASQGQLIEQLEARIKILTRQLRKIYNTTTDASLVRRLNQFWQSQPA